MGIERDLVGYLGFLLDWMVILTIKDMDLMGF
jgi:hypothetical protein